MRLLEKYSTFRELILRGKPVLVDVNSAANWFLVESPQDDWDMARDMHALTPPNRATYMEYTIPHFVNRNGIKETTGSFAGKSIACAVACFEIKQEERCKAQEKWLLESLVAFSGREKGDKEADAVMNKLRKDDTWRLGREMGVANKICPSFLFDAVVWIENANKISPLSRYSMYLDEYGKCYSDEQGTLVMQSYIPNAEGVLIGFLPFAFALSLMNCKNVELIDDQRMLPRNKRRSMERNGTPVIVYKWLHIKQMKKQVDEHAERLHGKSVNRLHFVRAHWATYTSDAPLFGKYEGTFFKPSHVRGNLASGIVAKGYKVNKP
jgi:hypothetical protein